LILSSYIEINLIEISAPAFALIKASGPFLKGIFTPYTEIFAVGLK
jgi:hypothetical protein